MRDPTERTATGCVVEVRVCGFGQAHGRVLELEYEGVAGDCHLWRRARAGVEGVASHRERQQSACEMVL